VGDVPPISNDRTTCREGLILPQRRDQLLGYANPVSLFSEKIGSQSGQLPGNFGRACTNARHTHAGITIREPLEARGAVPRLDLERKGSA